MNASPPLTGSHNGQSSEANKRSAVCLAYPIIGLGLLLLAFAVGLWLNQSGDGGQEGAAGRPRVGGVLADFSLNDLQGIEVRLSDYQGRPMLINFWATWCPPCVEEMPLLSETYLAYEETGFVLLAVDVGESWELVADYSHALDLPFPVLLDPDQALADSLRIRSFPTSILIGRDGKIEIIHVGMYTKKQLDKDLTTIFQSK